LYNFQIYKTLEELVNEEKYEEFYYRHHGGWGYGRGSQLYAALDQVYKNSTALAVLSVLVIKIIKN
jgi:hypothetical protein